MSTERTKIEDEIKEELQTSLSGHGLHVDNFYLSSLNPVEGNVLEPSVDEVKEEPELPKTKEEIKSGRIISGNVPEQRN